MEVVSLLSDQEYDEEVIFIKEIRKNTDLRDGATAPLHDTTNTYRNKRKTKEKGDPEIEVQAERKGVNALTDYPHFRFQCAAENFTKSSQRKYCKLCFCYVCDIPASECCDWFAHCFATDMDDLAYMMRNETLRKRSEDAEAEELSQ